MRHVQSTDPTCSACHRYRETNTLATTAHKTFYPLRIPVSHWQLRHYISHPEPDILYYASGHDVYALNTSTKKRKLLVTLPFEARCTAGGYGWVCVGGEDEGHFAAIKVDGSGVRGEVDSSLQGLERRWSAGGSGSGDAARRAASVTIERIGDEIVNSISIHRIQDEDAHLDDIVAVLTNNDKTVRVYSLPAGLETRVLDLPFAMNHATISPDGQTMVAVGDVNQAFFFQREILHDPPQIPKPHNRLSSASVEWTLTNVVKLHLSEPASTMGYFTTAWSPSGQLVAVGSEGGYITVFDVDMLTNPDLDDAAAMVAVVPSSRPDVHNPHPGAVRTMLFSPEPWDLLIWAEDQGRICIGDLRTGLKSRQVVSLEPKDEGLHRVTFEDLEFEPCATRDLDEIEREFLARYRQASGNSTAFNFANDYIEARRRARQGQSIREQARAGPTGRERAALLGDDPGGLTAQEQVILETLRTTRQREEARSQGTPRGVNYTNAEMFRDGGGGLGDGRSRSGTPAASEPSTRPVSDVLHSVPDAGFPELARTNAATSRPTSSHGNDRSSPVPALSSLTDDVWRSAARGSTGLVRLSDGSRLPRRRASVILTPPATNSSSASTATANEPSARATASHQPTGEDDEEENPWRTIEEHMSLSRGPLFEGAGRVQASSPLPANSRPSEAERQAELAQERAARVRQARQRERWHSLRAELANDSASSRASPNPNTTLGERVDPSTLASERTLERYLERSDRAAADRWDRIPAATAARLPTFMSQGGEILLRRSQLRGGYSGREIGVRTAGLAMSGDGRTLWAACEDGIFEIDVQLKQRMFWGAVEPR